MKKKGIFQFTCNNCNTTNSIEAEKSKFKNVGTSPNQNGASTTYRWEKKVKCTNCKKTIHIYYEVDNYNGTPSGHNPKIMSGGFYKDSEHESFVISFDDEEFDEE